jgi:tetratricopeptide (TPR) repeat protein
LNEGLDPKSKLELANLLLQIGFREEAIAELLAAASILRELGESEEAISVYKRVLDLEPENWTAIRGLEELAPGPPTRRVEEIVSRLGMEETKREAPEPEPVESPVTAPISKTAPSREATAEEKNRLWNDFKSKILEPDDQPDKRLILGERFLESGMLAQAQTQLELAHRLQKTSRTIESLASCFLKKGNYPKAVSFIKEGLSSPFSETEKLSLHYLLGSIYRNIDDIPRALDEFNLIARFAPDYRNIQELKALLGGTLPKEQPLVVSAELEVSPPREEVTPPVKEMEPGVPELVVPEPEAPLEIPVPVETTAALQQEAPIEEAVPAPEPMSPLKEAAPEPVAPIPQATASAEPAKPIEEAVTAPDTIALPKEATSPREVVLPKEARSPRESAPLKEVTLPKETTSPREAAPEPLAPSPQAIASAEPVKPIEEAVTAPEPMSPLKEAASPKEAAPEPVAPSPEATAPAEPAKPIEEAVPAPGTISPLKEAAPQGDVASERDMASQGDATPAPILEERYPVIEDPFASEIDEERKPKELPPLGEENITFL